MRKRRRSAPKPPPAPEPVERVPYEREDASRPVLRSAYEREEEVRPVVRSAYVPREIDVDAPRTRSRYLRGGANPNVIVIRKPYLNPRPAARVDRYGNPTEPPPAA